MACAPTGDELLTPDDAVNVLEEILEAQNQSYVLGLKLKLPLYVVDRIYENYSQPRDRLLQVLIEFMKGVDPRPTWRAIVGALRTPAVNLPQLAMRVEAAHFPDPTAAPVGASSLVSAAGGDASIRSPTNRPTLPVLLNFKTSSSSGSTLNIIQQIGPHYSTLGPLLLNDDVGAVTSAIASEHQRNAEAINQEILTRWLQGQGKKPVTWSTLIDVLKVVNVSLSEVVQDNIQLNTSSAAAVQSTQPQHRSESQLCSAKSTSTGHETPQQGSMTIQYVQAKIKQFQKRFNALKKSSRECLERLRVPVKRVADALTSLPADDMEEHKQFLESHLSALYQATDHSELFGTMNFHWNYLNYPLLDHLIQEFDLEGVKGEMKTYKDDLHQFRKKTPLKLFCQSQKKKHIKAPPEFHEVVAEFSWPEDITLEVVEEFRQEYADHYSLRECAMMLYVVRPGSFIVTWFIPLSIVGKLKEKVPISILKSYSVTKLEIAGECVYPKAMNEALTAASSFDGGDPSTPTSRATSYHSSERRVVNQTSVKHEYHFVEQPSEDFFCPITSDLLLQPHLTECCGKHLSREAATKIKGEGGACPLCNRPLLITMLDKRFRRQVMELNVFCHHEERGCGWQGELSALEHHIQSCTTGEASSGARTRDQSADGAMRWGDHQRTSSAGVIHEPLELLNYRSKFHKLLELEEIAHAQLLKERCDGEYILVLLQEDEKRRELRLFGAKPYHAQYGYFKEMSSDEVSYATQSASAAFIKINGSSIKCDILQMNFHHAEERLYVGFTEKNIKILRGFLPKRKFESTNPLVVEFKLKYSYFNSLNEAVQDAHEDIIARILPNSTSFVPVKALDDTRFQPFKKLCSSDQFEALKVIASAPSTGPPILISGPFGTGKTRVLAIAAHYFLQQSITECQILVCTQQYYSANAYLEMFHELTTEKKAITIIRLITEYARKSVHLQNLYKTVEEFKKMLKHNSHRRFLVITTCLTAKKLSHVLPRGFFTHIFLDEGAQMREPEAIAPLCMANMDTKIVIAGDKYQVGPSMLVLGKEPQKYGLSMSLLERLYNGYCNKSHVAKPYFTHLCTNFRCHREILNLARQLAYKMPLHPDKSVCHDVKFPLQFVCTSLDPKIESTESSINKDEAQVALKEAFSFLKNRPGEIDPSEICFLSPCRAQIAVAYDLSRQMKPVRKLTTYQIQGQEFRALFISTSEPTKANGKTRDSTKSISDPHVFITAITRARSLVVAVGNPFMLLKREKHMVKKYGDRGHCWSLFLKACLDNNTVHCCDDSKRELLADQVVSHLSEPLQSAIDEVVPSIPNTTNEFPATASSSEEANSLPFHFENYILKEMLGEDEFGVVYILQHKFENREYCALKIMRMPDENIEQKVKQEVEVLALLDKPNIVRYYDPWVEKAPHDWKHTEPWKYLPSSGSVLTSDSWKHNPEPPSCLYVRMDLYDKVTLETWLDDRNTVHNRKRVYVIDCFTEILEAVKYIHSNGLIHRNLKPSSIFFSQGKVKIGDFGLIPTSQVAVSDAAVSQSTHLRTSFYISPEQNKKEYGEMVDIYSLGIIYFEMNCPFGSDEERCKVLTALCNSRRFPNRFQDNLPHEAAMIEHMLMEEPQERPSAEQIASKVKNLKKEAKKKKDATIPRL